MGQAREREGVSVNVDADVDVDVDGVDGLAWSCMVDLPGLAGAAKP